MKKLKKALSMLLAVAIFFTCSAVNVFAQSKTEILPQSIEVSEFVSTQSSSVVSKSTEYAYTTETKYINIPKKATYSRDA